MKPVDAHDIEVRPVLNAAELETVYRLTHDCYVAKGYAEPQSNGALLHYPEFDVIPETTVLVALQQHQIVGSVSYTTPGPFGYTISHEFQPEIDSIVREGRTPCAVWRMIVHESCRSSRHVILALIAEVCRRTQQERVDAFLMVVNPQHERVYQRLLNATTAGYRDGTSGLSDAAAVLLRINRETFSPEWLLGDYAIQSDTSVGMAMMETLHHRLPAISPKSA